MPILAPSSDEDEDETSFKVICVSHFDTKLVAIVFSSVTQQWCIAASLSYPFDEYGVPSYLTGFSRLFCVRGCFYFAPAAPCLELCSCWTRREWSFPQLSIVLATIYSSDVCLAKKMILSIIQSEIGLARAEVYPSAL